MVTSLDAVLDIARAEIGYIETPVNRTKYGAWYGMNGSPWCGMFVSWVFAQAGLKHILPDCNQAYTPIFANGFKKQHRWGTIPKVGAIVFFDFPDSKDRIQHVGIVDTILSDGSLKTIEGNTSIRSDDNGGMVKYRHRSRYIVGYGYPDYEEDAMLLYGIGHVSKGEPVAYIQRMLLACGYELPQYGVDGDFGEETENAVKMFQQGHTDENGVWLVQDGVVGPKTMDALVKAYHATTTPEPKPIDLSWTDGVLSIVAPKEALKAALDAAVASGGVTLAYTIDGTGLLINRDV